MPGIKRPKVHLGKDGNYHAYPTVGTKANGRPDQRHIKRKTEDEVNEAIDELLADVRANAVQKAGVKPFLQDWLETFLEEIAPRRCGPDTIQRNRAFIRNWIVPVLGSRLRIDELTGEHLDTLYVAMGRKGRSEATQANLHGFLSRALEAARRRRLVRSVVTKDVFAPVADRDAREIQPIDLDDARRLLDEVSHIRNAARWSIALALGMRQGEVLGLRWQYVDLDAGLIHVRWQMGRRYYEHGCEPRCRAKLPYKCPQAILPLKKGEFQLQGGLIMKPPKAKSRRTIPVPLPLLEQLREHKERQDKERQRLGKGWRDYDLLFTTELGGPIDPRDERREWKDLLAWAGIDDARVHDMRHTAATVLLALGVDIRVVQEILGHSEIRMTERYTHVASSMAKAATDQMGSALWTRGGTPLGTP